MSVRQIGSFLGGAAKGFVGAAEAGNTLQKTKMLQEADSANKKYYEGLAGILDDYQNGRGIWAADQPTAPAAPLETPPPASMAPDAAGPPESIGGGSADTLMQRSLAQQQPASPLARGMAQPAVPGDPVTAQLATPGKRRLPFLQFLGG